MNGIKSSLLNMLFTFSVILAGGFLVYQNPSVAKRSGLKSPTVVVYSSVYPFHSQFCFVDFAATLSIYNVRIFCLPDNANLLPFGHVPFSARAALCLEA